MAGNLTLEEYRNRLSAVNLELDNIIASAGDTPVMEVKTRLIEALLQNGTIHIDSEDIFPHRITYNGKLFSYRTQRIGIMTEKLKDRLKELADGQEALIYTGDVDFSHTVPDWHHLFAFGFRGIIAELEDRLKDAALNENQIMYLSCAVRVYKAILVYLKNLIEACEKFGTDKKLIDSYRRIYEDKPETTLDALSFIVLFYYIQMNCDTEMLRSVGGLDGLLLPYYEKDLQNGVSEGELEKEISDFMLMLRAFNFANNIPFYICKTDFSGHTYTNILSYRLLEIYSRLNVQDPKIQIRCGTDAPEDLISLALKAIRSGNNSIVFMNDTKILPALKNIGISEMDAENYTPVGCYEPSAFGELACTCAGRVSIPKAVELTLSNGLDALNDKRFSPNSLPNDTWEHFYLNFIERLKNSIASCKQITGIFESEYENMNPSLVLSPTYHSSRERAVDLYGGGARYNDTSINAFGLATAVDALEAVKHLVFIDRAYTCGELNEIVKNNWRNNEALRLKCNKLYPKYGNGNAEADGLAKDIVDTLSREINGTANYRGGVFRLGMFSIDWYAEFGKKLGATADGRFSGDVISKNMSAAIGRDKNGVTGIMRSAASADGSKIPNGTVLDLALDASAVRGRDGEKAMLGIYRSFITLGITALQINVLDPETLKKAKEHPEEYSSLQVRLCGWNVYFTSLSPREQDEFIKIAENAVG